jgi:hypothetical protein
MLTIKLDTKINGCSSEWVPGGIIFNSYIIWISIERKLQMLNESFRDANGSISAMQAAEIPVWKIPNRASKVPKHIQYLLS